MSERIRGSYEYDDTLYKSTFTITYSSTAPLTYANRLWNAATLDAVLISYVLTANVGLCLASVFYENGGCRCDL